jgi:hypothetical protein
MVAGNLRQVRGDGRARSGRYRSSDEFAAVEAAFATARASRRNGHEPFIGIDELAQALRERPGNVTPAAFERKYGAPEAAIVPAERRDLERGERNAHQPLVRQTPLAGAGPQSIAPAALRWEDEIHELLQHDAAAITTRRGLR